MSDDLRERVARAIYEGKRARLLEAFGDASGWPEWEKLKPTLQEIQREECDPFIALIRNEVLEEAAKVAEDNAPVCQDMEGTIIAERCDAIATAIRALKEKA